MALKKVNFSKTQDFLGLFSGGILYQQSLRNSRLYQHTHQQAKQQAYTDTDSLFLKKII